MGDTKDMGHTHDDLQDISYHHHTLCFTLDREADYINLLQSFTPVMS